MGKREEKNLELASPAMIGIREAVASDLPVLYEFEQGVIKSERPFDLTLKTNEKIRYYDLDHLMSHPDCVLYVAYLKETGELVGSAYCRIEAAKPYLKFKRYGYIGFCYVSPQMRGKGVNRMILEEIGKWAKRKQIFEVRLDVYSLNEKARKAYKKVGFVDHMVLMRKSNL